MSSLVGVGLQSLRSMKVLVAGHDGGLQVAGMSVNPKFLTEWVDGLVIFHEFHAVVLCPGSS